MNKIPKKVLVTGASGGIGREIVIRLVQEGYLVIGLDKAPSPNPENFLDFFLVDLTSTTAITHGLTKILADHSPLWAIVYCAGLYPIRTLAEYTWELWDEVNSVNLKAAFQIVSLANQSMSRGGRIVFIASGAAHLGSRDVGYSASKAGLLGLVRNFARVLAPSLLVNAVCPGLVVSPMSSMMTADHFAETAERIPMGRPGRPSEIAVSVSFLLDEENSYMTGATLDINGGLYSR